MHTHFGWFLFTLYFWTVPSASDTAAVDPARSDEAFGGAEPVLRTPERASLMALLDPVGACRNLWSHRELIRQFTRREIAIRTKGSALGLFWVLLNPVLTAALYTFVFNLILESRWDKLGGKPAEFPLTLLLGTTLFQIFADTAVGAPGLVVSRPNYVTKVVFPLEVLAVASLGANLFYALVTLVVIIAGGVALLGVFSQTMWLAPLALLPLLAFTLGCGWFLAALGVYVRDVGQIVGLLVGKILMFLTPLFYNIERVPDKYRWLVEFNPLTPMVDNLRRTLFWGEMPAWDGLAWTSALGLAAMLFGYAFFQKARRGFADVL